MKNPRLTIETSAGGVDRVVVHLSPDESTDDGLRMLRSVIPALRALDRRLRRD